MKSEQPIKAGCVAIFGTGSDVGKSVVATALCRVLVRQGKTVRPFKAQNMSNNSGVTPEGLEMGRAQIVQAEAAGVAPHVDMNPILLKPTSEIGAQVVLLGRVSENSTARDYHTRKERLFDAAASALDRLRGVCDTVVMEGAGSCAEVNLMAHDIVNMRMAEYAEAPVILVADIHKGGVFAQIVGTLECLPPHQRERIAGFIVNRFRGDISLFDDGVAWIERRTGKPVLGVLPWYTDIAIEAEDSVVIEKPIPRRIDSGDPPAVAVIRIPHISNFTDFNALKAVKGVDPCFLETPQPLDGFRAAIIPGSKNTRHDLDWIRKVGWFRHLQAFADAGGHILGICGGYQMMGTVVRDPDGTEGTPGDTAGLGFLPVVTELKAPKTTTRTRFRWDSAEGLGYEIHMGVTSRHGGSPLLAIIEKNGSRSRTEDGCLSHGGQFAGTYVHGLFDSAPVLKKWLALIGLGEMPVPEVHGLAAREAEYDKLADHFRRFVDMDVIDALLKGDR